MNPRARWRAIALGPVVLAVALTALFLPLTACGSSSTIPPFTIPDPGDPDPGPGPEPEPEARTVVADPAGGVFEPGTTQEVALSVQGENSEGATIYYATDLSVLVDPDGVPTGMGTEYTDPIEITADTVLKFYAVWADATNTTEQIEGYVFALPNTAKAQLAEGGHGLIAEAAWRHWDDTGTVGMDCARCHTSLGHDEWARDQAVSDQPVTDALLDCTACHGDPVGAFPSIYADLETYVGLIPVDYPSGDAVSFFASSNACLGCHQGGSSGEDVKTTLGAPGPYEFTEVHYHGGLSSFWGGSVRGGYHYLADDEYVGRNTFPSHPEGYNTCVGCHMGTGSTKSHTFRVDLATCTACHEGESFETLASSPAASKAKIDGLLDDLLTRIQAHATDTIGTPIAYDAETWPHFFVDTNEDGEANDDETTFDNRYVDFDATLLPAAYNYHGGRKDRAAYVHNAVYMRQLLHDAIVDLGGTPSDIPPGRPDFQPNEDDDFAAKSESWRLSGHADVSSAAFRHWDVDYTEKEYDPLDPDYDPNQTITIPTDCAKCHSAHGYEDWAADGTVDQESTVLSTVGCVACHYQDDLYEDSESEWWESHPELEPVTFPSGATATLSGPSNVCMSCHQGLESGVAVNDAITATPGGPHTFVDVHYSPAAGAFFGTSTTGGYEYAGNTYDGARTWTGHAAVGYDTCIGCHLRGEEQDHRFLPQLSDCSVTGCHSGTSFPTLSIGVSTNYDDIGTLLGELYAEIQSYATSTVGTDIVYAADTPPFFFEDTDGDGDVDPGETDESNAYADFDDELLRAAYNYHFGRMEPAGYVHNGAYVQQLLYDAIDALGGTPSVTPPGRP